MYDTLPLAGDAGQAWPTGRTPQPHWIRCFVSDKPETQPAPAGPAEQQSPFSLPMPGPASRPTLLEIALLLGILLLAGALRVHRLGAKSLWLDEIFFASAARQGELLGPYGALTGTHAPLYLFLVRLASLVGESELVLRLPAAIASTLGVSEMALRLPAAIASILGVAALWALGRRMLGPTVGLLAAFFLALSAMHIEFAQEVHAYALLATLSTLLLWSLLRAAQREAGPAAGEQRRPAWRWLATWAPFILFALLGIYTHSYALVPVGLSLLFFPLLLADGRRIQPAAPGASSRRALLHLLIALAAVGIAVLPLLMGQPATAGAGTSLRLAAERGASLTALWLAFVSYRPTWLMDPLFFAAVTCWWLAGLIWLLWRRRPLGLALALWLLAPLPLIAWIASAAGLNLAPRRLLFLLPVFQLLVAVGVVTVARLAGRLAQGLAPRQPRLGPAAYGLLLLLSLLAFAKGSVDPIAFIYRKPRQDWRTLASILDTRPGPRDQVVLLPSVDGPLQWYLTAPATVVASDLAGNLERLCQERNALYVAETSTRRPLGEEDAAYLVANFIRVPLADLNLWYRNCRPDAWYGAGAEALFPLALHPDLPVPATRAAQAEFETLAAIESGQTAAAAGQADAPPAPAATPTPPPAPVDADALLASLLAADAGSAAGQVRLGAQALHQARSQDSTAEAAAENNAAAYAAFQAAVELDSTAWLAYALWADGLGSSGQITQALQVLDQGLAALPDSVPLQAARARWQAPTPIASDQDAAYRAALATGRSAMRDQRWDDVITTAQQAIAMAPTRFEAHLLLGDAYRGLGELAQALQAFQRALALAPRQSILHGRQAELLGRLGRFDEAAAAGLNALALDPELWENWYALGRVYMAVALAGLGQETGPSAGGAGGAGLGQETGPSAGGAGGAGTTGPSSASAMDAGEAARWAEALLLRSQELASTDNISPARALEELRAALPSTAPAAETGPDYASMTVQERNETRLQADRDLRFGKPAEALAIYQQLVAVDPQDRASRMGVANALAALGRVDEALAGFAAISAEWPDFPFAAIRRGALLEEQGDQAGALAAYREAVGVAPDNADAHFTLAFALSRAGQNAAAIEAFEAGLAIDPGRESARQALDALRQEP